MFYIPQIIIKKCYIYNKITIKNVLLLTRGVRECVILTRGARD